MSLLDTASLIVTPNGYKEGKLYSVIPSDGSGDMSVTRATTATRVNSAGLVELVPYNLLLNTNTFSSWNLEGGTLTSGQTDPLGGNTAYKYVQASGGLWAGLNLPVMSAGTGATQSIWVKSVSGSNVTFKLGSGYSTQGISNKTATSQWQLFTNSFAFSDGGSMYIDTISDAQGIYVWHPQLVEGTSVKEYFPTIDRLNIPRLDYSNGTCPSLLVEPQRTNLVTYSEEFNQWSPQATGTASLPIVTANDAIAPNGLQVADKIVFNSGSGTSAFDYSFIISNIFLTSVTNYTASIYLKGENGGEQIQIRHAAGFTYTKLTLTTEWQRFDINELGSGGLRSFEIAIRRALNEPMNSSATIYAWGAQIEAGSYATSYIPTTSASVTRNADVISKTGISSLIGQTEGTLFVDVYRENLASQFLFMIANSVGLNAYLNSIYMFQLSNGNIVCNSFIGGTSQFGFSTSGLSVGRHKLAIAYKQNDFVWYIDGVQVATDTSGNIPTFSAFEINGPDIGTVAGVETNAVALWKTRLDNATLATLTTL